MGNDTLIRFTHSMRFMLDNLPAYFFIKDMSSHYVDLSKSLEYDLGIKIKTLIGKSDYETPWEKCADNYRQNDKIALNQKKSDVLEPIPLSQHVVLASRCVRLPIHNDKGEDIGVLGQVEVFSTNRSFGQAIQALNHIDSHYGLRETSFTQYQVGEYKKEYQFTQRETECLFLLLRGKTAKDIGVFLEISKRTVEQYIENIKNKMGVSTRSSVIATALESGLLDIIPKNEIFTHLRKDSQRWRDFLKISHDITHQNIQ